MAGLAEVARAGTGSEPVLRELEGGGVGEIPLTPIVRYMVERGGGFDRYTQTIALELPAGIGRSDVVATIAAVVGRHDMLRACLRDDGSGEWVLSTSAPGSVDVDALVTRVEVPAEAGDEQWAEIAAREVDAAEGRLAPSQGIVTQFVWLDPAAGAARTGRLIVVAHHLVVDGVSWRILVPDFVTAWAQISHGQQPALQPVGTSFRTWAHALVDGAAGRVTELPLWTSVLDGPDPLLGDRPFDPSVDLASTVVKVPVRVDAATTETLLTTLPELYHGSVNDVLLTGLALALAEWRRARGTDVRSALIRLEGHGREEDVVPGSDLSRTVGWFTTMFPVRLDLSDVDLDDAAAGGASAGAALKVVKEDLRRVPDKGIGYGLLRYCNPETSARLAATPAGRSASTISAGSTPVRSRPTGCRNSGGCPPATSGTCPEPMIPTPRPSPPSTSTPSSSEANSERTSATRPVCSTAPTSRTSHSAGCVHSKPSRRTPRAGGRGTDPVRPVAGRRHPTRHRPVGVAVPRRGGRLAARSAPGRPALPRTPGGGALRCLQHAGARAPRRSGRRAAAAHGG